MLASTKQEGIIFEEIQKKLFYMIPEKWDSVHLYASIIEEPFEKPIGEMYFYYFPKGILKRNPVNVYQIPSMFNIDEESYNSVIQSLYSDIKKLRNLHRETKSELWTNLTITIKNSVFNVEYGYENLGKNSEFSPYERHIIWRYKNLELDSDLQTKEEKQIVQKYLNSDLIEFEKKHNTSYKCNVYIKNVHNIVDYERTLTLEAAIASQAEERPEKTRNVKEKKTKKTKKSNDLFDRVEKMKELQKTDDDIILDSDYMKRKEP